MDTKDYRAKIQITSEMIWKLFPVINSKRGRENKEKNINGFVYTYNKYADYFGINTPLEVRHFIAQIAHESDQFNAFEEYASGVAYEGRQDLGNISRGDGWKYKGRGPIQTTGRKNYEVAGNEILALPFLNSSEQKLFSDNGLLKKPELLQDPVWGTLAAFIYWRDKDLNSLCQPDAVKVTIKRFNGKQWYNYTCTPIEAVTRKVNGGLNGFDDRKNNYEKLKAVIK